MRQLCAHICDEIHHDVDNHKWVQIFFFQNMSEYINISDHQHCQYSI